MTNSANRELVVRCSSPRATRAFGAEVARILLPGDVVVLAGELGAGKTTFVKGVVAALGGKEEVTSPTFVLCHLYDCDPPVAHVDCWRLEETTEVVELALEEMLDDGAVALVEWGDLAREVLAGEQVRIELSIDEKAQSGVPADDGSPAHARTVVVHASGASWKERLQVLRLAAAAHDELELVHRVCP